MASTPDNQKCYQCVHCGHPLNELYKDFKKGVIKLIHCNKCNEVADKYIEYDSVIIFLDILLLQRPAYRHVLINSKFKGHWRLLVVLCLCDALAKLMQRKVGVSSPRLQPNRILYSALELDFYRDYILSAAEMLTFVCTVVGLLSLKHIFEHRTYKDFKLGSILRAVLVSSMGRLLVVPAIIWGQSNSSLAVSATHAFVAAANVQALRVAIKDSSLLCVAGVVLLGYGAQTAVLTWMPAWVPHHSLATVLSLNVTQLLQLR